MNKRDLRDGRKEEEVGERDDKEGEDDKRNSVLLSTPKSILENLCAICKHPCSRIGFSDSNGKVREKHSGHFYLLLPNPYSVSLSLSTVGLLRKVKK